MMFGLVGLLAAVFTVETVTLDGKSEKESVSVEAVENVMRFTWPRAKIPANVKSVSVSADFATARKGEDGFWIFPNNVYGTFKSDKGRYRCPHTMMSMFGMKTTRIAFCAIVTGMKYSFTPMVAAKDGEYRMVAMFDRYMDDVYEDIDIEFHRLPEGAGWAEIAKAYRNRQLSSGAVKPIAERAKTNPWLDYAIRNPEVRIRQAWKQAPSPVMEQVTRNEPPVKTVVTFDRFRDIVDESVRQGVKGAEFCLVGWNRGGHDGAYPQIFPVEPSLGGEEKLKAAVKYAQDKGYQVVGHSSFRDCYMIADTWDSEYVVEKNPDGTLKRGKTAWSGGRLYTMCPQRAYERFCPKQCAEMATLGFKGLFYVDVTTSRPLFPCKDRRHPLNNSERAVWEANILDELRDTFGGSASEGGFDFCAGSFDSALTIQWVRDPFVVDNEFFDGYVPIWQMVYHGIILSTPFRTMINCPANPDYRYRLKLAEFGGRPTFYWHSWFVTGKPPSMGTWDLEATTDEKLRQGVTWMKEGYDEYARRRDLQYHFMDGYEPLREGVIRVSYSNGAKMIVNYNDHTENVDGVEVPAMDYTIVGCDKE